MTKDSEIDKLLKSDDPVKLLDKLDFESALKTLEGLVVSVEAGSLPLEKAVKSYEVGRLLVEHLRNLLAGAEKKLQVLERGKDT